MNVPIDFLFPGELRVGVREQARGDIGRDNDIDKFVEAESGEDFVGVEGEGAESEGGGEGLGCFGEEGGGWREGVAHFREPGNPMSASGQVMKMWGLVGRKCLHKITGNRWISRALNDLRR